MELTAPCFFKSGPLAFTLQDGRAYHVSVAADGVQDRGDRHAGRVDTELRVLLHCHV